MEDAKFQKLWWKLSDAETIVEKKAVLRTAAALHVFFVSQVIVLISHFVKQSDRLDALEILLLRVHDLSKNKDNILTAFSARVREYVRDMLNQKILDAVASDRYEPLLTRQFAVRGNKDLKDLIKSLRREFRTTNDWEAIKGLVNQRRSGFNYDQTYKVLHSVGGDPVKVMTILDDLVLGLTCREAVQLLLELPLEQRVPLLEVIGGMLLDAESKWVILDYGFRGTSREMKARVMEVLRTIEPFPRSALYGTVRSHRVVFLIDVSTSMECVFETNQHEIISRMRFVVRDTTRVIKEQLQPGTMFNIVAYARSATRCFPDGMREVNEDSIERAALFMRTLKPEGPTNTLAAFAEAFDEDELDAVYMITDGKPSFSESVTLAQGVEVPLQTADVLAEIKRLRFSRGEDQQVPIHATAVLTGMHASDDVEATLDFCRQLAESTGGIYRCAVHRTFVLYAARQAASATQATKNKPRQMVRREYKGLAYQAAIVASFVFFNLMAVLAQELPFGGRTSGEISAQYGTYITAHPVCFRWYRAFALWGGMMVLKMCLPSRISDGLIRCFRFFWPMWCVLGGLWLVAFQNQLFVLSCIIMAAKLGAAIMLYLKLEVGQRDDATFDEIFWVHLPVGSMLAWTSYMFMLNIAIYLRWWEWYGWGWQWEWGLILLCLLCALAFYLLLKREDLGFAITVIWVVANIVRSHWPFVYQREQVAGGAAGYTYAFPLCSTGVVLACLLAFASAVVLSVRLSRRLTRRSSMGQRRQNRSFITLQTANAASYVVMLIVSALASRWGYKLAGMSEAPLNRQTCGDVADLAGTLRLMPARWTFRMWPIVYACLLPFVLSQALPTETTQPLFTEKDARDSDLGKRPMIRGFKRERLLVGLFNNRLRFVLPLVHKWQLTRRSQQLIQKKISYLFFAANMLNMIYLVLWTFNERGWSTVLLLALLGVLVGIYLRVNMWRFVLTEAEQSVVRGDADEDEEEALRALQRKAKATDAKSGGADDDVDFEDLADEQSKAGGAAGAGAGARLGGKGKGEKGKEKPPDEPVSMWERVVVHAPFSLYLGWVSFLVALQLMYLAAVDNWGLLGLADSAWAVIIMCVLAIAGLGVLVRRKDPVFPLGILFALLGIFWENTTGVCPEHITSTMAGRALLESGLHRFWNLTTAAECAALGDSYAFLTGKCRHVLTVRPDGTLVDNPVTCDRLGTRDGEFIKGYAWISGRCVEDPGLCPYELFKGNVDSHTPSYVLSTTALVLFVLLALATAGIAAKRAMDQRKRNALMKKRWSEMMTL